MIGIMPGAATATWRRRPGLPSTALDLVTVAGSDSENRSSRVSHASRMLGDAPGNATLALRRSPVENIVCAMFTTSSRVAEPRLAISSNTDEMSWLAAMPSLYSPNFSNTLRTSFTAVGDPVSTRCRRRR